MVNNVNIYFAFLSVIHRCNLLLWKKYFSISETVKNIYKYITINTINLLQNKIIFIISTRTKCVLQLTKIYELSASLCNNADIKMYIFNIYKEVSRSILIEFILISLQIAVSTPPHDSLPRS